ncbi:MAG: outer membrane protein [Bacteroidetes bacterium OLB12]|nr:MAG: outer membrane protein [Bacteroidetes bacterium OLB12]HNR74410.1 hypothetical protein [Cyclobacteriaceae bacterium]HNU41600.1 hypothetical protein [Cyclobacteriaceae bacterium]
MKHTGRTILVFISLLMSCSDFEPFEGEKITQFAASVSAFSSQFSSTIWSAQQALGENNVPENSGTNSNAWSSLSPDAQREFLVLGFSELQTVSKIEIFENAYPGAIDTVYLRNSKTDRWVIVYAKPARTDLGAAGRIFSIHLIETQFKTDAIRLAINSPAVENWNEIDAVSITGQK